MIPFCRDLTWFKGVDAGHVSGLNILTWYRFRYRFRAIRTIRPDKRVGLAQMGPGHRWVGPKWLGFWWAGIKRPVARVGPARPGPRAFSFLLLFFYFKNI